MNALAQTIVSTEQMCHDRAERKFITEASDLSLTSRSMPQSIEVQSHKTNTTVTFVYCRTEEDREENETLLWVYTISPISAVRVPAMRGYTLIVLND